MKKIILQWSGIILAICIVGAVSLFFLFEQDRSDQAYIHNFLNTRNQKIKTVEHVMFTTGPFWYRQEHDRIFYIEAKDTQGGSHIYWIRFSLYRSVAEELPNGKFQFIEM